MKIRPIKEKEALEASKIVATNYSKKYGRRAKIEINGMFRNYAFKPKFIVAEEKEQIEAFGGYMQSCMDYGIYEIFWVNVAPRFQKKGIGTKIVKRLIEEVKKSPESKFIILSTTKPKFYEKFNFKILTETSNKYKLMILKLRK